MKQPEPLLRRAALRWFDLAEDDLRLAHYALTMASSCPYRLVAYHAQQCAEKYLKGNLVLSGVDFPFTHNVARLLELSPQGQAWAEALWDAEELSAYAIAARYPSEFDLITREEAGRAIQLAEAVRRAVRATVDPGSLTPREA